jgi:hypothetical protein
MVMLDAVLQGWPRCQQNDCLTLVNWQVGGYNTTALALQQLPHSNMQQPVHVTRWSQGDVESFR